VGAVIEGVEMKYMLMIYANDETWSGLAPDDITKGIADQEAFNAEFAASGELVAAGGLGDARQARVVRVRKGVPTVTEGPYMETKEYLASYYVLDCADEERALEIAARMPFASFREVEMWPILHESDALARSPRGGADMPNPAAPTSPESTIEADAAPRRKRGRPAQDANEGLRRALIEQSARLFREKGYGNTTVRDIAAATGVHAGSWFYYFKTKQDILQAVIEHGLTVALADIEAIDVDGLPPREAMRQLVRAHLTTILAPNQDFIPVMLYEWRSLDAEAQERIIALKDRYESIWTRLMERLRASGDWAQPTPVDRLLMFGALNWTAQWYQAGAGISIDALADQAVLFILRTPAPPAA